VIGFITDTHFTVNFNTPEVVQYLRNSYSSYFNFWKKRGVKYIIHGGDIFDKRKNIDMIELNLAYELFFDVALSYDMEIHSIIGNHDIYFKNTNDVNSPGLLLRDKYPNLKIYYSPEVISLEGQKFLMLPWINSSNQEEFMKFVHKNKSEDIILIGHLDLVGFVMQRGVVSKKGFEASSFEGFQEVISGHYHSRSTQGKISYMGSATQLSFADANEERGCYCFIPSEKIWEFHPSPDSLYHRIVMKGQIWDDEQISSFSGKNLNLIVLDRGDDIFKYEQMIQRLNEVCLNLKLTSRWDAVSETGEVDSTEDEAVFDNRKLLEQYVVSLEMNNSDEVLDYLLSLYDLAIRELD
jgi:DNA repair exonuclease SbcCD nuclease subunit